MTHLTHTTRLTLAASTLAVASGCTTMKAIDTAGDDFKNGHIVAGLWESTMGVAIGAIVDVVTLGGTTTPDQGAKTIATVASPRARPYTPPSTPSMIPVALSSPDSAPGNGRTVSVPSSPAKGPAAPSATYPTPPDGCATIQATPLAWRIVNGCPVRIIGKFCYLGEAALRCGGNNAGGFGPLDPGQQETISAPANRSAGWRVKACN